MPSISVIIVTRNRYEKLRGSISRVLNQTIAAKEVVIVDDASEDSTPSVAREYPVRYVRTPKRLGIAGARNFGIHVADGEWLAFTDDDAIVDKEWLHAFTSQMADDVVGMRGRVVSRGVEGGAFNSLAVHYNLGDDVHETSSLLGCNMIIRKKAFEAVGLFDERLRFYHDEYDLSLRLSRLGKVIYCPSAIVKHDYAQTVKGFLIKKFRIGLWRVYVNAKNHQRLIEAKRAPFIFFIPTSIILGSLFLISPLALPALLAYSGLLIFTRYLLLYAHFGNLSLALIDTLGEFMRDLGVLLGLFRFYKA